MNNFAMLFEKAKEFPFEGLDLSLQDLVYFHFVEEAGTPLKVHDAFGRRILVIVGDGHNLVVFDRYPDLCIASFNIHAIHPILRRLPAVLGDQHMDRLLEFSHMPKNKTCH